MDHVYLQLSIVTQKHDAYCTPTTNCNWESSYTLNTMLPPTKCAKTGSSAAALLKPWVEEATAAVTAAEASSQQLTAQLVGQIIAVVVMGIQYSQPLQCNFKWSSYVITLYHFGVGTWHFATGMGVMGFEMYSIGKQMHHPKARQANGWNVACCDSIMSCRASTQTWCSGLGCGCGWPMVKWQPSICIKHIWLVCSKQIWCHHHQQWGQAIIAVEVKCMSVTDSGHGGCMAVVTFCDGGSCRTGSSCHATAIRGAGGLPSGHGSWVFDGLVFTELTHGGNAGWRQQCALQSGLNDNTLPFLMDDHIGDKNKCLAPNNWL